MQFQVNGVPSAMHLTIQYRNFMSFFWSFSTTLGKCDCYNTPWPPHYQKTSRLIQIGFHSQNKSCNQIGNDSHKKNFQLSFSVVMKSLWLRRKKPPSQGMNYEPGSRSLKTSGYNSDSVLSSLVCKNLVFGQNTGHSAKLCTKEKISGVKLRNAPIPSSTLHFCVVWTVTNPETKKWMVATCVQIPK